MKKIFIALCMLGTFGGLMSYAMAGGFVGYGHQQYNYGYHQNYGYNYQTVYETNPVVVIGVPVSNLGVGYYWSVGAELREQRVAQLAAELVNKKQAPATKVQQQPTVAPAPGPGIALDFDLISSAVTEQPTAAPGQITELDQKVQNIFSQSCSRCHKPGTEKPALKLLNADGSLFKALDWKTELQRRQLVYDSVRHTENVSAMPKNADQLDDESLETVYQWLREKANQ